MRILEPLATLRDRIARAVGAYGVWGVAVQRAHLHAPWLPRVFELWRWRTDEGRPPPADGRAGPVAFERLRAKGDELRRSKPHLDRLLACRPSGAGERVLLAAFDGDRLLGATWLTQLADGTWWSHDTFVVAGARRCGVGVSLIQAAQRAVVERTAAGATGAISGEVLPYNKGSRAMLRACGWRRVGWAVRRGRHGRAAAASRPDGEATSPHEF